MQVSVGTLVGDVARDELMLNSALPRTVAALMLHPGRLTTEYIRGRIVRYIPPLRLYLVSSVLFFVALSFVGLKALERVDATIGAAVTADSVRAVLTQRQAELQDRLEAGDTAGRSAAERARLLRDIASTETALAALADTLLSGTPERRAGLLRMATAEGAMPRGTMQPWAVELGRGEAPGLLEPILDRKLAQVGHLPWHEAGRQVLADLLDYAPHMVFLLLPVFTLLLKLLYIRRGRYYAEHFVFALHLHAFFFLMFFIMLVLPWNEADRFLILWMLAYVWLAMKRVYGQGWFRTTVKWWALGWSYMLVLALGLVGLSTLALLYL